MGSEEREEECWVPLRAGTWATERCNREQSLLSVSLTRVQDEDGCCPHLLHSVGAEGGVRGGDAGLENQAPGPSRPWPCRGTLALVFSRLWTLGVASPAKQEAHSFLQCH